MHSPPLLHAPTAMDIHPEPLTPASFAPFGTAITAPLPSSQSNVPKAAPFPPPLHPAHQPEPTLANQSTALKYSPISPLTNHYAPSTNPRPQMSMFSCFPRRTLSRPPRPLAKGDRFAVKIIERHPFTTQTFCPLGLLAGEESATAAAKTYYIVIVAPSLETAYLVEEAEGKEKGGRSGVIERPPDLSKLKAFVAHGGQAVTYAP